MSNIQKVGSNLWVAPEHFGVTPKFQRTEHALNYYPNGASLLHETLNPGNKKFRFDYEDEPDHPDYPGDLSAKYLGEVFDHSSAGGHDGYLDMRVNSVTNRDVFFYSGLIVAFIWWTFDYLVIRSFTTWVVPESIIYGMYFLCFGLSSITFLCPLATPVRFHKKNQEVYVWHKKVLYRIPWQECELSVQVAKRNEGYRGLQDGYQLTLWLNPKHAVNQDLTGQKHVALNMLHNMNHHIPLYTYWEYVRRYMNSEQPLYIEITKKPRRPSFNTELARKTGYLKAVLVFIITAPFVFLFNPNKMALLTPVKHKWPKEVHEWTGECCNWH
ncbi:DUF6708 domain-containing protein [Reinekea thalattae]|uniref:DUF6708 domain-containing protein n=1 Tax=Reinekea thalattae TaxID=2593301 RepID=A0A5C8Z806_9GAMM|nr:DUF6708 domain-containing protein [Reinekea thalattae]TXR54235.1 hypothetical protein FME95_06785 [Reinekea thalattae]